MSNVCSEPGADKNLSIEFHDGHNHHRKHLPKRIVFSSKEDEAKYLGQEML